MNVRYLSTITSIAIIIFLYWQIDASKIIFVFLDANLIWLSIGLVLVIPITLLTAFRLTFLSMDSNKIDYLDALKLTLAASVMNLVLPSKMGDLAKGIFIVKDKKINYSLVVPLVVLEKISDILALLLWCFFGLLYLQNFNIFYIILLIMISIFLVIGILIISSKHFANKFFALIIFLLPERFFLSISNFQKGWFETIGFIKKDVIKIWSLSLISIFLWFIHLLQIWLFILSLSPDVGFLVSLALTPLAIFIGLAPLTFAGIGTRDFAFIYLYSSYFPAATGAALGVLSTLRYIIPAIAGIPFFSQYLKK